MVEASTLRVLVVGGGPVAARKAARLATAGARIVVVAPETCAELEVLVGDGTIAIERRRYESGDIGDVDLVIAATNDRAVNATVSADAKRAHRLVNIADVPGEGGMTFMTAHSTGPLTIAVNAGGVPAAAVQIRNAMAERFDERYAAVLADLSRIRRTMLDRGDAQEWRVCSGSLISDDFCDEVESGALKTRMTEWP
ncbi:MAG: NAD(P)-dependent oxidoreductase [bacterium]